MAHDNVIDISKRLKKNSKNKAEDTSKAALVVDMTARRNEIISDERRQVKRTILTEFIGAFVIVPGKGLRKVALYDISENGISFDLGEEVGEFKKGEEIAMRVYLNQKTYFPFTVSLKNTQFISDESVTRHGGEFLKGDINEDALFHFVKFIETVSASLQTDNGDVMVSNLND